MSILADPDTRTAAAAQAAPHRDDEPWPIWAAIMVYLNLLVIAAKVYGLAGLVLVAVPAALLMVVVLLLIVKG